MRWLRYGAFLAGVFVVGYVAAALWFSPPEVFQGRQPVPRVLELTQAAAVERLEADGLTPRVVEERTHPRAPRGVVTWQDPTSGTLALEGAEVRLWVSAGPSAVTVPDVVGLEAPLAVKVIQAAGLFVARTDTVYGAPVSGVVTGTRPPAGTARPLGSGITLLVGAEGG